ncbi:MAG: hypothetical protein AB7E55_07195 [Pigmentiphaga sp.]|uniref:hypothetical protein n=1 Tax=Pseudomonas sp. NBRC 100443 TaxID=1113665 RepID=UPI0024A06286|nr:hypothetical protein [Pseudomonas sp. NBRC 100443]GLU41161.1 hypothetical protein Pssp01_52540 [Pseudomonas sp. NBRC 100443]
MKLYFSASLLILSVGLNGCAQDYSLAPPANSEQVTVRIKVPPELEAEKMEVMYRSTICQRTRYDAYGKPYKVDGFHGIDVQPQQQGLSDIYEARLARDGGGACRWHLANVTFGVAPRNTEQFGSGVTFGGGGGVVVIFDHNDSPMGGADIKVDGDLTVQGGYYPLLQESFLGGHRVQLVLWRATGGYRKYQALNAREVYFEPMLYSNYVVRSVGPKVKKEGNYRVIIYPDGSVQSDGRSGPSFSKLETIRKAAESQK